MTVKPIPEGYHSLTPYLVVRDASRAIGFYREAFGAVEMYRMDAPGGKVGHADLRIGDSHVMLADECPEMGAVGPESLGGTSVSLLLYVEDADGVFARAVAAGATVERPVQDQFYGDRSGLLRDPFGHRWSVATRKEDLMPEEIERRHAEAVKRRDGS